MVRKADPPRDVDELGEAIEALDLLDLDTLTAGELAQRALAVEAARSKLEARSLTLLRAVEARGAWVHADPTAVGTPSWLANHTGEARAVTGSRCRLATRLATMPATAAALADGEITGSHARVLAGCRSPRTEAAFAEQEDALVDLARSHTADEMRQLMTLWLRAFDPDGPAPRDRARDEVFLSPVLDRWRLRGDLGMEAGAELAAFLNEKLVEITRRDARLAEVDPTDPACVRTTAQRRAEALAELVAKGAAAPSSTKRRRPAVTVLLDQESWERTHARRWWPGPSAADHWRSVTCRMEDGTVVPPSLAEMWVCDADVCAAALGADGELLHLGRARRTADEAQRRALTARDKSCVVPGCDRPPAWCDAHHVVWWEHGGRTDIDNLVLLCRRHHGRVHKGDLCIRMDAGTPVVTDSLGVPLRHPRRPPGPRPPGQPPPNGPPGGCRRAA